MTTAVYMPPAPPFPAPPVPPRDRASASSQSERDLALVRAMAEGDSREALGQFYDRFAGLAMALLLRILGTRSEAEDLLQEVFVELWRRAAAYDPERGSVQTWVAMVVRSRGIDAVRSRARRPRAPLEADAELALVAPSSDHPDEQADSAQRRHAVQAALSTLSHDQREVLDLAYFRGLSQGEIAEHLGIPIGTVKSRTLAALRLLRGALGERAGEEP
jgi:RNA polymerase sigma-70 factor (ECF subfamily)